MRVASVKDWAALVTALAALVGVLSNAWRTQAVQADVNATYQNTALTVGGTADDVSQLQARVEQLERRCGAPK